MSIADGAHCSSLPTKAPPHLANVTVPATNSRETGKELALSWGISPALLPAAASLGALSGAKQAGHKPEGGQSDLVHRAAPL